MAAAAHSIFSKSQEWKHFRERYSLFLKRLPNLERAIKLAFPQQKISAPMDRLIFLFGWVCVEDFEEILLLCENGRGIGAMKILRGLFERVVIAHYLHHHPEEAPALMKFSGFIQGHRLKESVAALYGKQMLTDHPEREEEFKRSAERSAQAKSELIKPCKKCGALKYTWNNMVTMADEVGLGTYVTSAYLLPTQLAHATMFSLIRRVKEERGEDMILDRGPTREDAHTCLAVAHALLLRMLGLQRDHFKRQNLGNRSTGYLFETNRHLPYSPRRLQQIVKATAAHAKISKRVYPHLLRHSVATTLLERGMPIEQIQKFLGHAKLETTQVYAESTPEMIKDSYRRALSE